MSRKKRRIITILITVVTVLLAALLFLTQSKSLFEGEVSTGGAHASVMSDLEGITEANPRVVDLGMLGSHNANTYSLSKYNGLSGEADKAGTRMLYRGAWGLMYRYSKNQVSDVYAQLSEGARFLQFRCGYFGDVWCGSHSAVDGPMDVYIQDVPGEIVTLSFHVYGCGKYSARDMERELANISYGGHTLMDFIPYSDIPLGDLTYNDVTVNGTKGGAVVMFQIWHASGNDQARALAPEYLHKFYSWGGGGDKAIGKTPYFSEWCNRMSSAGIAEGMEELCEEARTHPDYYKDALRVMQIQSTPTLEDIWDTAGAWSLVRYAKKHNVEMISNPNFGKWMEYMPIVLVDFVTSANGDFNRRINQIITAYNENLIHALLTA